MGRRGGERIEDVVVSLTWVCDAVRVVLDGEVELTELEVVLKDVEVVSGKMSVVNVLLKGKSTVEGLEVV